MVLEDFNHRSENKMLKFTENQKKIPMLLTKGQMNLKELSKAISASEEETKTEIKFLIDHNLVKEEEGNYFLAGDLAEKLAKRKEISEKDQFDLKIRAFIEISALEPKLVKKQVEEIEKALRNEKNFTIYDLFSEKIEKDEEYYSTFVELTLSIKNFQVLVNFMYFYGPSSIEVIKPQKLEIDAFDLTEGLMDMADMIHKYTDYITKMMSKRDLDAFYKKIYTKK